jgi:hypothetical protein
VTPDHAWATASIQSGPEDLLCCRRDHLVAPTQRLATRGKHASVDDSFRHLDCLRAHDPVGDVWITPLVDLGRVLFCEGERPPRGGLTLAPAQEDSSGAPRSDEWFGRSTRPRCQRSSSAGGTETTCMDRVVCVAVGDMLPNEATQVSERDQRRGPIESAGTPSSAPSASRCCPRK